LNAEYEAAGWKKTLWGAGSALSLLPSAPARQAWRASCSAISTSVQRQDPHAVTGMGDRRIWAAFFLATAVPFCESYGRWKAGSLLYRPAHSKNMARWESCSKA